MKSLEDETAGAQHAVPLERWETPELTRLNLSRETQFSGGFVMDISNSGSYTS